MRSLVFPMRSLAALAVAAIPFTAIAGEFRVEKETLPAPFLTTASSGETKVDGVIEASAVEAIGDGKLLLVAHDKSTEMFVAESATGQIVGKPLTTARFPNGAEIPPKWEGLASDDQGFYYVAGTHGGKSDSDRPSRSFLFRFRLTGGTNGTPVAIDENSVRRWHIGASLKDVLGREVSDPTEVEKRKIEGLAVRSTKGADGKAKVELIVGLRAPTDRARTFAADITKAPEDDSKLTLTPLFSFDAGTREGVQSELTSLVYVPEWKGFLASTTTEDKQNVFHGNTLWFVSDAQVERGGKAKAESLLVFQPAMKAEGLTVLPDASKSNGKTIQLAVSYDNDGHTTHIPSRLQILTISRNAD